MDQAWLQQRVHLTPLVRTLDAVLRLADEQYEQGRASVEAVTTTSLKSVWAYATAKAEQEVHRIAAC
jgi:hypothetical protein